MTTRSGRAIVAWLVGAIALALVAAVALVEFSGQGTTAIGGFSVANYKARAEIENRPAPNFRLPALQSGPPIGPDSFPGRVLVLNFWASWCAPCRLEAPGLRWVFEHYRHRGVSFLGVDERDNDPAGLAFIREFHITYPSVTDSAGSLADDYELLGLPTTFIVDATGTIRYRFLGYLDRAVLQAAVEDVLSRGGA